MSDIGPESLLALASLDELGTRELECGCCVAVDLVALNRLRQAVSGTYTEGAADALRAAAADVGHIPCGYPTNPKARSTSAISRWLLRRADWVQGT